MRIAHVISSCSSGGAEVLVKSLLKEIKIQNPKLEIQLWVMSNIEDCDLNNKTKINFQENYIRELENTQIIVKHVNKRPKKEWRKAILCLRRLYNSFKPDIIHTHLESVTFHTCRALCRYKTPIVQTIHNTVISKPLIERLYIKNRVYAFVAISQRVKQIILEKISKKKKIFLINNGIELNKFINADRVINDTVKYVISIGRLTEQKDHKTLLEAISILKKRLKDSETLMPEFQIIGDGDLRDNLASMIIDLEIGEHTKMLGVREDIPQLLNKADIYVMSSTWEGLSISLIEALASGISIIATNAGSNDEIIKDGENGILVPIKSPNRLANSLYDLMNNTGLRKRMNEYALKDIKKFDIKETVIKHMQMYIEIFNSNY